MSKAKITPAVQSKSTFNPKSYVKDHITEEDVVAAKASFDLFDSDQGGTVDIKELKAAMTSLGFQSKSQTIFHMLADLDSDGSGTIDFQQWLNLLTKRVSPKDSRESINKVFALFDVQRTGFITLNNIRKVASQLGQSVTEQELQELMDRADTDFDGLVSEQEFYNIVNRFQ